MAAKANSNITIRPLPDLTCNQARDARARAWRFIFDCYEEKQKGGPETAPDNAERSFNAIDATENCNR